MASAHFKCVINNHDDIWEDCISLYSGHSRNWYNIINPRDRRARGYSSLSVCLSVSHFSPGSLCG